ncbi:MAG: class II fructose-1,6-bisphosphate aldolase [Nanoarchaeota archaeon]
MLVSGKKLLDKANRENYAVGAFNFLNMEVLQAIMQAAKETKSPVIIATSEGAIKYAGMSFLHSLAKAAAEEYRDIPIALHVDHGKDLGLIKAAVDKGWTSVMYDGSGLSYEENVKNTKEIVRYCRWRGVSVEAELGVLAGVEDDVSATENKYTDPAQAVDFVKKTGCYSLAIAIGTSHGAFKFKGESKIDIERLKLIKGKLKMPIVLHGASGVYKDMVAIATKYGAKLEGAAGVSDEMISQAVKNGINKVNCDTDLRIAFMAGIRQSFKENPKEIDLRSFLGNGKKLVYEIVKRRMVLFGSAGKA